jgi:hypothetical protein
LWQANYEKHGHVFGQRFGETNPSGSLRALTHVRPTPLASGSRGRDPEHVFGQKFGESRKDGSRDIKYIGARNLQTCSLKIPGIQLNLPRSAKILALLHNQHISSRCHWPTDDGGNRRHFRPSLSEHATSNLLPGSAT